ncbi:uncharacterized protein RCC_09227 [Ramularia collo-cygni]|uniref:J domain-containing protein n=1 Tax=Ramularia collo-cygni TaxID=112498 RepID=A0A2D3V6C0_9PEZI|nr:uncharacterized protein RCC_09227 [Ramularia collo-cygni]CZT23513.1 uncharacterized protein RCC_09227 [Ramularia collo-cygni]
MARVAFDPFEALDLARDASGSTIKARYHELALRYHPNRHQGSSDQQQQQKSTYSDHFHRVHEAYNLLSKADNRRRRAELLDLLDLEEDVHAHFAELIEQPETPEEEEQAHHIVDDQEVLFSSDADDDLPNLGLQRRQTDLSRHANTAKHVRDKSEGTSSVLTPVSPVSPTRKRLQWPKLANISTVLEDDTTKEADYFTQRRRKLKKLEKQELEAFWGYREAMALKFKAEEEAEKQHELYERARWKREYFERAPKETRERMRSFQHFMGAVSAFEHHTPRRRGRSTVSYGSGTPVEGPGESAHFLSPTNALGRQKHKRAWSTDVSGDQTDSEEDSGDAHFRTMSNWRRSFYGKTNVNMEPHRGRSDHAREQSHPDGPFQLVIRQPTNLSSIQEGRSSSGETPSPSSREPSPSPYLTQTTNANHHRFTIVPTQSTAQLLGASVERHLRSPSPVGRALSSSTREQTLHTNDGCSLELKIVGTPHHYHIPRQHVHLLNDADKARLLGAESDAVGAAAEASKLLDRLNQLDPTTAAKFEVKQDIKKSFAFRLIYEHKDIASQGHQSFIALSYRRKLSVRKTPSLFTLPLDCEMFEAVWQERGENEGIWIDQISIDQDSDFERTVSMSAMDMVYSRARRVIVALDDIEFNHREGEQLQSHMAEYNALAHVAPRKRFRRKQPSFLESHEHMFEMIRKILRSSWFKRAWCRHEMRLGKHHIFLIPCTRNNNRPGRDVLRFNGKFMAHLLDLSLEVPFESDVESVKPALHAFFRDRSKMAPDEREMASHHGNMSTVVAEVMMMEAGGDPRIPVEQREADARKDKIAIILNTMECGLALHQDLRRPSIRISQDECYHDLLMLGLAAQDPGSLCAIGSPLPISPSNSSVLYTPTVADAGLNNSKTLQRLPENARLAIDTSGSEHYIQLDLKFLQPRAPPGLQSIPEIGHDQQVCKSASLDDALRVDKTSEAMQLARHIFEICDGEGRKWGRNRKRYLTHDKKANFLFGPMHDIYVETLACVLECGPAWMSDIAERYSMGRWKVDLHGAYELLIALQNTTGKWPAEAWSERSAGFIVDFVNFLVIRGLPLRQLSEKEDWRPVWFSTEAGGKVLSFVPVGKKEFIRPAIPTALIHPDYVHLSRLWILEPRRSGQDFSGQDEWTLLGKSVLFSDEVYIEHMSSSSGDLKAQQKIYGRRRRRKECVHD